MKDEAPKLTPKLTPKQRLRAELASVRAEMGLREAHIAELEKAVVAVTAELAAERALSAQRRDRLEQWNADAGSPKVARDNPAPEGFQP